MRVGLCLIIKNEQQYLEEWLKHHKSIGIDYFHIFDNQSDIPITLEGLLDKSEYHTQNWVDNQVASQCRAYYQCCSKNLGKCDMIGFIDTDEFIILKKGNIKDYLEALEREHGKFDGLGMYWRMYGDHEYPKVRQSIDKYTKYSQNPHIKSILRPEKVMSFPDPHKAILEPGSIYIDELGRRVVSPLGTHTSKDIWVKHVWGRSVEEWAEKMTRGTGDKVVRIRTWEDFYNHNKGCIIND